MEGPSQRNTSADRRSERAVRTTNGRASRPTVGISWRRVSSLWRPRDATGRRRLSAPQLFVLSFLGLIGCGTVGFMTLPGLYAGPGLGWLDALFTATSAVCVTGLIVVDTATFFTAAGQAYILLLIQLGGLGILTFTSVIFLALGMRLSIRHESFSRSAAAVAPNVDFRKLLRDVLLFTFSFEILGALLLYVGWSSHLGASDAIWHSVFHAVSAFCNAGFSTFTDSIVPFQEEPAVLGVIIGLIVLGGLGFLTLEEMRMWFLRARTRGRFRLTLHTRVVLVVTFLLIVGGWMLFTLFEWNVAFAGMGIGEKLWNALFMSVTARTAGFNTVNYTDATEGSNFLTIILMSIGGSPGSTAGGLKTTTVAVIGLLAWSRLRGDRVTGVWARSIPDETAYRAVGLFVIGFGTVTAAIFLFTVSEIAWTAHGRIEESFLAYMFEAVSAFNTVGLSMGVTGDLSGAGRVLTILLMFLGRVGMLTMAAALARPPVASSEAFHYAYEDVAIG